MKLNLFKCPNCKAEAVSDAAYITCDGCGTFFYLSGSLQRTNTLTNSPYGSPSPYDLTVGNKGFREPSR